ncbi:hypothetical protein IW261DRAFT_1427007 [Armillaria novae-zelandiae]|uniref:Uncharacterized protein n=1 Tax=Armillaria novae-zelandiae TaxID=153914 RepID=A0AA39NHL8_9AGAR|nr:hypothetical protein IW261DRAFT_1427007 [Armillaria novae-zelandiae]
MTSYTVVWDLRGKREVVALAYGGGTRILAGQFHGLSMPVANCRFDFRAFASVFLSRSKEVEEKKSDDMDDDNVGVVNETYFYTRSVYLHQPSTTKATNADYHFPPSSVVATSRTTAEQAKLTISLTVSSAWFRHKGHLLKHQSYILQLDFFDYHFLFNIIDTFHNDYLYHQCLHRLNNNHVELFCITGDTQGPCAYIHILLAVGGVRVQPPPMGLLQIQTEAAEQNRCRSSSHNKAHQAQNAKTSSSGKKKGKKTKGATVDEIIKQAGRWFSRAADPFINVKNAIVIGMKLKDAGDSEDDNDEDADGSNQEDRDEEPTPDDRGGSEGRGL